MAIPEAQHTPDLPPASDSGPWEPAEAEPLWSVVLSPAHLVVRLVESVEPVLAHRALVLVQPEPLVPPDELQAVRKDLQSDSHVAKPGGTLGGLP